MHMYHKCVYFCICSGVADVSWMPYNFKNVINKANVQNIKKKELRRRISTYVSNVSGSIYSVVKRVVINKYV